MILYPASNTIVQHTFGPEVLSATVEARDFNGRSLPITAPTVNNNVWTATLTIPADAPLCSTATDYYTLTWIAGNTRVVYNIQVVGYSEGQVEPPPAALGVVNVKLYDELLLPSNTDTVSVKLLDQHGNTLLTASSGDIQVVATTPGGKHYTVSFNLGANALPPGVQVGMGEYLILWEFGNGALQAQEYRQAFMISPMLAGLVANTRMTLDQMGMSKWLPRYQLHDVELVDCLHRAADRINTSPPQAWTLSPDRIHKLVPMPLREATVYEVLARLYMAEGMAAFDYQGGSISATVDRTQFISTRMTEATSWLDANLKQHKFAAARLSGKAPVGRLHVTLSAGGSNNNYSFASKGNLEAFRLSAARTFFF